MKRSILIVDDEQDMLDLLKRSLEPDLNCRVEPAPSGEAALKRLAGESFDLVLADIKMPGMDGLELLEIIKRKNPEQTVVMMTAFGQIETAVAAMKSGAYDFITKPFEHDALLLRLEKALERSALLKENQRLAPSVFATGRVSEPGGQERGHAAAVRNHPDGGQDRLDGPDHGGVGHRQGPHRPRHPCLEPAQPRPLRGGQLPDRAGEHPGERAVRLPQGGLHTRDRKPHRPFPGGPEQGAFSSTKSATSAPPSRPNSCGCCRRRKSNPWEIRARSPWM